MQGSVVQVSYGGSQATCPEKSPGLSQQNVGDGPDETGDFTKWEIQ